MLGSPRVELAGFSSSRQTRTLPTMVRPDRAASPLRGGSCRIELAGASPAAVSAGAPRSRPRAREEIPSSEWGVKSPRRAVRLGGGEQVRRPSIKRTLQPREINNRKVVLAEPLMPRRRQQTAPVLLTGAVQDARGVERTACGHSLMRNRRGPSRRPSRAKAVRISRRRKRIVPGGSPRGS